MTTKKFDPVLREAMDEISAILKKKDIGGVVALTSPTHGEFKMYFDTPSWSVISFDQRPDGAVAVRVKAAMATDPDVAIPKMEATMHMIYSCQDIIGNAFMLIEQLKSETAKHVDVVHNPVFSGARVSEQ